MRNRIIPIFTICAALIISLVPYKAMAASGIFASGGGTFTAGQQFTVTVTASGDSFDSVQGSISVNGPVSVVSFNAGGATWLPGKTPKNGGQFVGITSPTSSLLIARVTLKANSPGSGSVAVSGVKLARSGSLVGSAGGSASFTITRALTPPGSVKVSSSTHPDPATAYEATSVSLAWEKPNGVTQFAYAFDQAEGTVPAASGANANTSATYENQAIGTYYFHIRAYNADGWGPTTHFKVNIKEPDPKIDETLAKPTVVKIDKIEKYSTNLEDGTFTGIEISGKSQPGFTINPTFTPALTPPEGTALNPVVDEQGNWKLSLNFPVRSGFYSFTVQGQKEKILTPVSEPIKFEVSIAQEGDVRLITAADAVKSPEPSSTSSASPETKQRNISAALKDFGTSKAGYVVEGLLLLAVVTGITMYVKRKKRHDPMENL